MITENKIIIGFFGLVTIIAITFFLAVYRVFE